MKLKYTPKEINAPHNVFVVKFKFEYGDADVSTCLEKKIKLNEQEFIEYLEKVNECAQDIDDARAYERELPDGFAEDQSCHGVSIPIEYDTHYQDSYAGLSISSIVYFNENGVEFNVTQEQT